ncbi:TetR/AcrR family transcriptional regulator [Gordonia desulfuricans]|uniref:TetR/AcrR family transcriptional regulator n=1 Tax=Gordonia desulfuricans TaxID=89051 RepID=A0A7K3LK67_9ACTN|nr:MULTISPECIES: TetR/AcrR family transcriptional regulator [Gordonia]EMP14774.2 TetR family transcriptional regulator [Gordonia sp. NB41Y]NDK88598.1 TetR/AcrR family transcriptional regulator [Gordonia desulfuricans]WLP88868.1 TetR/AcrR family transcriptional regulator [Gordonia sp. NB41Y]
MGAVTDASRPVDGQSERSAALRSYGGVDGDERIARRRIALMDAALDLLGADGGGSVTVRGVCRASGLNPRYFYESFDSVEALVAATFDRVVDEISDSALAGFGAGDDIDDKVAGAVGAIVDIIDDDRRKGRLLFSPKLLSPTIADKRSESTALFAMLTVDTASNALAKQVSPEAIGAAQFEVGGLARLLSAWLDGDVALGRDEVVALSVRLMMSLVDAVAG